MPLQLDDVARRAGLGVGTVYRRFPTAEALVETLATPCLEALAAHGERALVDDDPWRAFAGFLSRTVEAQAAEVSLAPVVAASTDALPRTTELKQTLWSVGASLFDRARVAGVVHGDLTSDDMVPLMCRIAFAANVHDGDYAARAEVAQRYLTALLEGLHVQARR
ncbi:AcrR family transcriptional regulator [Catenulispora sp. MAP12-49]|uniref:TetR/AcrR family transcriptional regulator n=1 Tax=Catenulispora sp. MAP12-49 TaxID=3156302 RepID=UPI003519669B